MSTFFQIVGIITTLIVFAVAFAWFAGLANFSIHMHSEKEPDDV